MQLFGQAQAAKDEAELKRVAEELRATITKHFRVPEHPLASASMIVAHILPAIRNDTVISKKELKTTDSAPRPPKESYA
jgi:hypothetical protein